MSEPWEKATCPVCQRHSDNCRMDTEQLDRPGKLFIQTSVRHSDSAGHTWSVRWVEEAKVSA